MRIIKKSWMELKQKDSLISQSLPTKPGMQRQLNSSWSVPVWMHVAPIEKERSLSAGQSKEKKTLTISTGGRIAWIWTNLACIPAEPVCTETDKLSRSQVNTIAAILTGCTLFGVKIWIKPNFEVEKNWSESLRFQHTSYLIWEWI